MFNVTASGEVEPSWERLAMKECGVSGCVPPMMMSLCNDFDNLWAMRISDRVTPPIIKTTRRRYEGVMIPASLLDSFCFFAHENVLLLTDATFMERHKVG